MGDVVNIRRRARRFKFDRGDWIAERDHRGEWQLVGKVVVRERVA